MFRLGAEWQEPSGFTNRGTFAVPIYAILGPTEHRFGEETDMTTIEAGTQGGASPDPAPLRRTWPAGRREPRGSGRPRKMELPKGPSSRPWSPWLAVAVTVRRRRRRRNDQCRAGSTR